MSAKAVFLDRDGTLNEEMGYINHLVRFRLFDFTAAAIKCFNDLGYLVFIITNQAGLARGYFDESLLNDVHKLMLAQLGEKDAHVKKIYFCPYLEDAKIEKYKKEDNCRKPKPGMILQAQKEFNLDLKNSVIIGDRYKDMEMGFMLNIKNIFVLTGYGLGEFCNDHNSWKRQPDHVCKNIYQAALLLKKLHILHTD